VERLGGVETDIQPDVIGQRQRSHQDVRAEGHAFIKVLLGGDALVERPDALVDPRHQDPVRDEPGFVVGLPGFLAEVL